MGQSQVIILIIIANIILLVFIGGIILFIFQYRRRKMEHIEQTELLQKHHHAEIMAAQLEIQTQTMQHIGREIHDNVGQKLVLASLYTQQLAYENKAPQVNDKIESVSHIINESLAELRQLSKSLTDDRIAGNGIIELLQQECDKINGLQQCAVEFSCNDKNIVLPYQTKNILLRIAQEFLQNSIKHSGCKNIQLSLNQQNDFLSLAIKDDGKGFSVDDIKSNGIGVNNMKKRTALLEGSFDLQSSAGNGTSLYITIPAKK